MAELTRRHVVLPMPAQGPHDLGDRDPAFALEPRKDPAALRALESDRDHCYPELAREPEEWIRAIAAGGPELSACVRAMRSMPGRPARPHRRRRRGCRRETLELVRS